MNQPTIHAIETIIDDKIISTSSVSGGDINDAYRITTKHDSFFVKLNNASFASDMFAKEANGLRLIEKSQTIPVPKIIALASEARPRENRDRRLKQQSPAFLILEWIESSNPSDSFWKNFGNQLANLHQQTAPTFGLKESNYIGSLVQHNNAETDAISFFINQRLLPQIELAKKYNKIDTNTIQAFNQLFKKLPNLIPNEKPALIHGDLWSGNFMVGKNGEVILVDPSVSFCLREMDLAMTKLFGGFDPAFYEAYQDTYSTDPGLENRIPIYQLYYLMVHVNLFGGGYLNSVRSILKGFV